MFIKQLSIFIENKVGRLQAIMDTLSENDINIRMIEQGADEINIIIGVDDINFKKTIRVLYDLSEVK